MTAYAFLSGLGEFLTPAAIAAMVASAGMFAAGPHRIRPARSRKTWGIYVRIRK